MTGSLLLVAAVALAALALRSAHRPGPERPAARARVRTNRPAVPPGPARRPAPVGSTAALRDAAVGGAAEVPGGDPGASRWSELASGRGPRGRGVALGAVRRRLPGAARRDRAAREAAVPEVLDVLRATIVAGAAPYRALLAAAETAPEPLAGALDAAVRAAAVGLGAGQALAGAGREQGLVELVVAGEALDLAETAGAPPAPVLAGVAAAATDRLRARQARSAATAQARLAARVVSGMAPCFLLVLAATSPSDAAFLVRERLGWVTLAAAMAFELAGIWWAGRIVGGGP